MTTKFIEEFCIKHGLEVSHFDSTILITRRAKNESLPGDLPIRNIELFDIRLKDKDWKIWSHVDGITDNGQLSYLLVFGNDNIDMDDVVDKLEKRIKELKVTNSLEKIKNDFK